ncbi:hypothetical protein C6497_07330 [Candidatus Poribacteria bacterium]|nr:MAG: hypothetical protein C6497_07330 [Candidatus Poribacteria bacterium]
MSNSVLQNKFILLSTFGILLLLLVSIQAYAEEDKVEWGTSIEEAQSQAAESGKPIMMDFYTDW